MAVLSYTVLARFIWKLSQQIITIFRVLARISFDILPSLQFLLLFFAFGSARSGKFTFVNYLCSVVSNSVKIKEFKFNREYLNASVSIKLLIFFFFSGFITVAVLPVFLTLTRYDWDLTCGKQMHCKSFWIWSDPWYKRIQKLLCVHSVIII